MGGNNIAKPFVKNIRNTWLERCFEHRRSHRLRSEIESEVVDSTTRSQSKYWLGANMSRFDWASINCFDKRVLVQALHVMDFICRSSANKEISHGILLWFNNLKVPRCRLIKRTNHYSLKTAKKAISRRARSVHLWSLWL